MSLLILFAAFFSYTETKLLMWYTETDRWEIQYFTFQSTALDDSLDVEGSGEDDIEANASVSRYGE